MTSREEIEFLDTLEKLLIPFGFNHIRQYEIEGKRIDLYIPELNIAIEYDEDDHRSYSYEQQEGRQKEIEKVLGCKFIRISNKKDHIENCGMVMKEIMCKGVVA